MNNRKLIAINLTTLAALMIVVILGIYQGGAERDHYAEAKKDTAEKREAMEPEEKEANMDREMNEQEPRLEIIEKRVSAGKGAIQGVDWQTLIAERNAETDGLIEYPNQASEDNSQASDESQLSDAKVTRQYQTGESNGTVRHSAGTGSPGTGEEAEESKKKKPSPTEKTNPEGIDKGTTKPDPVPQPGKTEDGKTPDKQDPKPKPHPNPEPTPNPKPEPNPEPTPNPTPEPTPDPEPDQENGEPADPTEEPKKENGTDDK